jgi:hypothetical protein
MKKIREAQRKRSVLRRPASTIVQVPAAPTPGSSGQGNNATPRRPGCCFACGVPGHWQQECTVVKPNASASGVTGTTRSGQQPKISNELNKQVKYEPTCGSRQIGCLAKTGNSVTSPLGKLRNSFKMWHDTNANKSILSIINIGYKLPLLEIPPSVVLRNNASALNNYGFVTSEISKLLDQGLIANVSYVPKVVNPPSVAQARSGKKRLVLDCRHTNLYLYKYRKADVCPR